MVFGFGKEDWKEYREALKGAEYECDKCNWKEKFVWDDMGKIALEIHKLKHILESKKK